LSEVAADSASSRVRRLHARALAQAEEMVALAAGPEEALRRRAEGVSRWSTVEHLAHLALVDRSILERLDRAVRGLSGTGSIRIPTAPSLSGGPAAATHGGAGGERIPSRRLSLLGRLVLFFGFIPRGKGRTPDPFRPETVEIAPLRRNLADLRDRIADLAPHLGTLQRSNASFRHFVFGELTPAEWLRFLGVHHHHHLKIIRDVRKSAQP
jgi:hypothetical protein